MKGLCPFIRGFLHAKTGEVPDLSLISFRHPLNSAFPIDSQKKPPGLRFLPTVGGFLSFDCVSSGVYAALDRRVYSCAGYLDPGTGSRTVSLSVPV